MCCQRWLILFIYVKGAVEGEILKVLEGWREGRDAEIGFGLADNET